MSRRLYIGKQPRVVYNKVIYIGIDEVQPKTQPLYHHVVLSWEKLILLSWLNRSTHFHLLYVMQ